VRRWVDRLRGYWPAIAEATPSAFAGVAIVVVAALVVLLAGLALAALTALLY
jgi:hypothetical protein